ncbi:hypothetical protein AWI22_07805 [Enterobacter bugandensis]|nr:hypothetical protein AWI22_07805 [Enterobacter bugandensis]
MQFTNLSLCLKVKNFLQYVSHYPLTPKSFIVNGVKKMTLISILITLKKYREFLFKIVVNMIA